jgi:hypothetical protein
MSKTQKTYTELSQLLSEWVGPDDGTHEWQSVYRHWVSEWNNWKARHPGVPYVVRLEKVGPEQKGKHYPRRAQRKVLQEQLNNTEQ